MNCRLFPEQTLRTTHNTAVSVTNVRYVVPAAPGGLFYQASEKGFRDILGPSEGTVERTITAVFVLGGTVLRRGSEPWLRYPPTYAFLHLRCLFCFFNIICDAFVIFCNKTSLRTAPGALQYSTSINLLWVIRDLPFRYRCSSLNHNRYRCFLCGHPVPCYRGGEAADPGCKINHSCSKFGIVHVLDLDGALGSALPPLVAFHTW